MNYIMLTPSPHVILQYYEKSESLFTHPLSLSAFLEVGQLFYPFCINILDAQNQEWLTYCNDYLRKYKLKTDIRSGIYMPRGIVVFPINVEITLAYKGTRQVNLPTLLNFMRSLPSEIMEIVIGSKSDKVIAESDYDAVLFSPYKLYIADFL